MTIIVTGAAGFIGSNLVKALNQRGETDIVAVDNLSQCDKFKNLVDCEISDFVDKNDFIPRFQSGEWDYVEAVLHQGACSDTMQQDGRYLMANNYQYSLDILDICTEFEVPFIYASSASVYGGGRVFEEKRQFESPLNAYGYSKFLFDQIVRRRWQHRSAQIAGFRYFNVYGPRESHKARMASVAFHQFHQYQQTGQVKLFEGSDGFAHGEQRRDFVSIEDIIKVNLFFLDNPQAEGIFNVGTGRSQSFNDVSVATINACRNHAGLDALTLQELIDQEKLVYIPFPAALKGKYQSFTEANISQLRSVGYQAIFLTVEQGVKNYIDWLIQQ